MSGGGRSSGGIPWWCLCTDRQPVLPQSNRTSGATTQIPRIAPTSKNQHPQRMDAGMRAMWPPATSVFIGWKRNPDYRKSSDDAELSGSDGRSELRRWVPRLGASIQILQRILFILEFSRIFRVINLVIVTSSLRIAAKPFRTTFIFSCNFISQAAGFRALAFIPMHMANVATPVV